MPFLAAVSKLFAVFVFLFVERSKCDADDDADDFEDDFDADDEGNVDGDDEETFFGVCLGEPNKS